MCTGAAPLAATLNLSANAVQSLSTAKPRPNVEFVGLSVHCPNFCDVLLKAVPLLMVWLMTVCCPSSCARPGMSRPVTAAQQHRAARGGVRRLRVASGRGGWFGAWCVRMGAVGVGGCAQCARGGSPGAYHTPHTPQAGPSRPRASAEGCGGGDTGQGGRNLGAETRARAAGPGQLGRGIEKLARCAAASFSGPGTARPARRAQGKPARRGRRRRQDELAGRGRSPGSPIRCGTGRSGG